MYMLKNSIVGPRLLFPSLFWQILTRIHIPVKEVQLKLIEGEKSKISSLTLYLFLPSKINKNENKYLWRFIMGNVFIFSPFGYTRDTPNMQFFNDITWVPFMSFVICTIPVDFLFFGCILKPEALAGEF